MFCQPFRDRVRMHVLELLVNFPFTPDIEVIESGLPEAWQIPVVFCKSEARLGRVAQPLVCALAGAPVFGLLKAGVLVLILDFQ